MLKQKQLLTLAIVLFAVITVMDSAFIVNQQRQAIILQFREHVRTIQEPGLYFKIPFVQTVAMFDKRVLPLEPPQQLAILADQKRLIVDAFARWRISDPLKFFQRLTNERKAADDLSSLVNSSLRQVLGTLTMKDVLSSERSNIMITIRDEVNRKALESDYGIEIVDVRIRRADLPDETSQSIFARMRSERQREAAQFRAGGQEQSQEIRSKAEKERTILIAEAKRQADTLRGQGDEEALRIIARASGKDPQFYAFFRSLQAYRATLATSDTSLILSPEGDFFRYFGHSTVK
jgi:membrane protease subunit HflC